MNWEIYQVTQHRIGEGQAPAFRSGEAVPLSGLWRPRHDGCTNPAELWIHKNELFPLCEQCGAAATFTLLAAVQHISEDPDFQ